METGRPIPLDYAPAPPSRVAGVLRFMLEAIGRAAGHVLALVGWVVLGASTMDGSPEPVALLMMGWGVALHVLATGGTIGNSLNVLLDPFSTPTAAPTRLPQFGRRR